ncbi:TlpA family protein disulfide reductase [Pedobacter agri]|uniref:TlpA family protein disulfide reductase n=1 Tax=Pedobacter agri TaxID=454586 RepID=UPI0029315070|nr:TlpA disulfide reductase family protein [Pedobacter agri]
MKKPTALFLLVFTALSLFAQKKASQPLIIQGKLINSPERMLKIFFTDEQERITIDTIHLQSDGSYYLKTYHINRPQRTSIQQNRVQLNQIYVAPGYELTITGDASDHKMLLSSRKMMGKGAAINAYRVKVDSVYASRIRGKGWYEMDLNELLSYIASEKKIQDSIHSAVFAKNILGDPYFETFKRMISLDNQSIALYNLLEHIGMNRYSYEKMTKLVAENTPAAFKGGISNDSYLNAEDYKTWLIGSYLTYKRQLDKVQDSTLSKVPGYSLKTIKENLSGKVRDYYLSRVIQSTINASNSIDGLNAGKKKIEPYLASFSGNSYKGEINEKFADKEQQLMKTQVGKPAPDFKLVSADGKTYRLVDFKGKVVYIDLWASWCVPCRESIPD